MSSKSPSNHAALWKSKDFSDLTIECGGRSFKVHKSILSMSIVFNKMFTGPWKETNSSTLQLPEEADVFEVFLKFFYLYKIDTSSLGKVAPVFYAKVYRLADYYDVQTLLKQAQAKLDSVLRACSIEEHVAVLCYARENLPAARSFRTMMVCRAKDHIIGLSQSMEFREYLREDPDLACELLFSYAHHDDKERLSILSNSREIKLFYSESERLFRPRSDGESAEDKTWKILSRWDFERLGRNW